ncbi:hypothetical protein QBC42DRAFT_309774 [Cladorrhinum samala]|uniref:RBR-type E3 ubiquitin transferase n=1 Tax=Cladorrhinum samala TaxID=585594 RepID=A0AAV9HAT1_9PEZI|nr:hypothetical protein QBC42DRAFT_309774 [Cladorrhinum samala]
MPECIVCLEPKAASDFPTKPLTVTCEHPPSTCLGCIRIAIAVNLDTKPLSRIACPECEEILSPEAIQRYADDVARQKYNDMVIRQALEGFEGFIWCASGCGSGQIHDGGVDQPIVKCNSCGGQTCFQHRSLWHSGVSCEEWDLIRSFPTPSTVDGGPSGGGILDRIRRTREIQASEEIIGKISKRCPGCARSIEKNGGW